LSQLGGVASEQREVALNGTVPSYPQYLEAAAVAHRVANALVLNITVSDGVPVGPAAAGQERT
jgi:hypothetical protein